MIAEFRLPIRTRDPDAEPQFALVDGTEFWALRKKWFIGGGQYATTIVDGRVGYLHRLLMDPPEGMVVDHINGDPLDNRRQNLRVVTQAVNAQNRKSGLKGKSGKKYRGVYPTGNKKNPWRAMARCNGVHNNLGVHPTEEDAAAAVYTFWAAQPGSLV